MFPVLFSVGHFSVSTFGIFLAASFLYGLFLVWRLARAWELNEERVLDLTLITFIGGLIGARLEFAIENPLVGLDIFKILLINKFPGLSFWGGLLGSWLTLALLAKRVKIDFWQACDIASVGLLGALCLTNIGCLLGGCNVGVEYNSFLALPVLGEVGKRFPISAIEALLLFIVLKKVWSTATHFHPRGKVAAISLIFIGIIKLITLPLKQVKGDLPFSVILIFLGLIVFYKVTKRAPLKDIIAMIYFPLKFISDSHYRSLVIVAVKKNWYNQRVLFGLMIRNLIKRIRSFNVYFSHKNSKYY